MDSALGLKSKAVALSCDRESQAQIASGEAAAITRSAELIYLLSAAPTQAEVARNESFEAGYGCSEWLKAEA
ncbi:MAG: hypothetical protein RBJ76_27010 [Stenomitos frigidus ULC029]